LAEKEIIAQKLTRARQVASRLAETLLCEPGVKRFWLFGSVANGKQSILDFDIDIAFEGGAGGI